LVDETFHLDLVPAGDVTAAGDSLIAAALAVASRSTVVGA